MKKIITGNLLRANHKVFAGNYYLEFYNTYEDALNYCEVYCIKSKKNSVLLALDEYVVEKIDNWATEQVKFRLIVKVLYDDKVFYMRTSVITDRKNLSNIFHVQNGNFDIISKYR